MVSVSLAAHWLPACLMSIDTVLGVCASLLSWTGCKIRLYRFMIIAFQVGVPVIYICCFATLHCMCQLPGRERIGLFANFSQMGQIKCYSM